MRSRLLLAVVFAATIAGCNVENNKTVNIKIAFNDQHHAHQLTNISVIAGSDKFFFHSIAAGTAETVTLSPGAQDDKQVSLLFSLDGQQKSWDGPKFDIDKGYRIEINIDALGVIQDRHCILPCSLE